MKLSIITVNYNDAIGLERTIKSVISQSYHNFEFIIIDGGSTDNSVDVIKRYDKYIDFWVSEPDGGIYPAMNKGLKVAKGEYINFMNGGDCYHTSDVLEKVFLLDTDADIITGAHFGSPHPNVGKNGVSMLDLYRGAIDHQASFIKREVALRHPYDEQYRIVSDWKFFVESLIFDNCSFFYTDIIIVDVDMNGISNTNGELDRQERQTAIKILLPERIIEDYNVLANIHPELIKMASRVTKSRLLTKLIVIIAKMMLFFKGSN